MSPVDSPGHRSEDRFPRVSGDEPIVRFPRPEGGEFSPRERG